LKDDGTKVYPPGFDNLQIKATRRSSYKQEIDQTYFVALLWKQNARRTIMMAGRTVLSRFGRLIASLFLVLAIILTASNNPQLVEARKQSRNTPHHHRGQLKAYNPGPFQDIQLTAAEEALLAKGGAVMKQTMPTDPSESGTAICVQDVQAPLSAVWHQILDLENYDKKVSKVKECTNYDVKRHNDGSVTIKTKQVLGVLPGYSVSRRMSE